MAIEDYEAELDQLDKEIADIDSAIALLATGDTQLEADMRTEFAAARERLVKARATTLEQSKRSEQPLDTDMPSRL